MEVRSKCRSNEKWGEMRVAIGVPDVQFTLSVVEHALAREHADNRLEVKLCNVVQSRFCVMCFYLCAPCLYAGRTVYESSRV